MANLKLFYATNRHHLGDDLHPDGYGAKFSDDGMENLRFGVLSVDAADARIRKFLKADAGPLGRGDGEMLSDYLAGCAKSASITTYPESISRDIAEVAQKDAKLGSRAMFEDLMTVMEASSDVLIYIHGFNVAWHQAVGGALALQLMQNNSVQRDPAQTLTVVLFSWPSDGAALPWVSYKSDRSEAAGSGGAVGRGLLKARDFLVGLRDRARAGGRQLCGQDIHLLCHSMGNYLLENALARLCDFSPGNALPRLFEHVFLCAPDLDDDALEAGKGLCRINQVARQVTLYYNRHDKAMYISDYTKGNPERLGHNGAAHPAQLHNKIHQVDCTPVVSDFTGHSYYLSGNVNADIRLSIDGRHQDDPLRQRQRSGALDNCWEMRAAG
ncbi:MAG: alpha/beta hydrolase [Azonexus sp.]